MPESLMQSCIKVANEAPTDLKSNLRRAWSQFDMQYVSDCSRPKQYLSTLFSLCFFHSTVLGRRKFGQQGWSRPYSFNTGDLKICADVLRNYIDNNDDVPWDDLRYIFGEIMYGGHITDFWDRRTNNTYLEVSHAPLMRYLWPAMQSSSPIFAFPFVRTRFALFVTGAFPRRAIRRDGAGSEFQVARGG